jgi:hypothetical protein
VHPLDRVGVRVAVVARAVPDVAPPDPQAPVALGYERRAVGPDVDEHAVEVGDAAPGKGLRHARVGAQLLVALVPLVDRHVRVLSGQVPPVGHSTGGQGHHGPVRLVVLAVPADHQRLPSRGFGCSLGRLAQLDGRDPPTLVHATLVLQDRGHLPELLGGQGIERVHRSSCHVILKASGPTGRGLLRGDWRTGGL